MFYVNYIKFKDDAEKSKNFALLISITLVGLLFYFFGSSIIKFMTGKQLSVYEYIYVIVLIYLIANVVLAFKIDGAKSAIKEVPEEKKETKIFTNNNLNKTKSGEIVDDFIFDKKIFYNYKKERSSLIPEFGNEGLEAPEEDVEEKLVNDLVNEEPSDFIENHDNIEFSTDNYKDEFGEVSGDSIEIVKDYEEENNGEHAEEKERSENEDEKVENLDKRAKQELLRKKLFDGNNFGG